MFFVWYGFIMTLCARCTFGYTLLSQYGRYVILLWCGSGNLMCSLSWPLPEPIPSPQTYIVSMEGIAGRPLDNVYLSSLKFMGWLIVSHQHCWKMVNERTDFEERAVSGSLLLLHWMDHMQKMHNSSIGITVGNQGVEIILLVDHYSLFYQEQLQGSHCYMYGNESFQIEF